MKAKFHPPANPHSADSGELRFENWKFESKQEDSGQINIVQLFCFGKSYYHQVQIYASGTNMYTNGLAGNGLKISDHHSSTIHRF